MEKDLDKVREYQERVSSMTDEEYDMFFRYLLRGEVKFNPLKEQYCESSGWKDDISDDLDTHKYQEPETKKYFETDNIVEYLRDCRNRQGIPTAANIRDYELVHKDTKQKMFFTTDKAFEERISDFIKEATKWMVHEFKTDPQITADESEDYIVVVCKSIVVENYEQKIDVLKRLKQSLPKELGAILGDYVATDVAEYESIPSIANQTYQTEITKALMAAGYRPNRDILRRIHEMIPTYTEGMGPLVVINIFNDFTGATINNFGTDSIYCQFIKHIIKDKPDWFTPGEWMPKTILVEKFNELYGKNISIKLFMRCMYSEKLMDHISDGEKRSRVGGKLQRLFLGKNI